MTAPSSPDLPASVRPGPLRPLADTSVATIVAGFVAMMTGYTSSLVLMFQAGQAAHLTPEQISSWIWSLSIGMGVTTIGLSLWFRAPTVIAWSTPGAALLISSLPHVPYAEAIGAYIVCALLLTAVGLTGWFDTLMKRIPGGIAAALLAGILFEIGIEIFHAAQVQTPLVLTMFFAYLLLKRAVPRYAIVGTLVVGVAAAATLGLLDFSHFRVAVAKPVFTMPAFSVQAIVSIGIPLFVVAMASQNVPGIAVLRADGYNTPSSPLIATTGLASLVLAPFGSHGINLAAITAAICTGPHA
ncbi:benzoate/H(+) symporter BenE family transporter, partial [Paraburkholderia sp.]